MDFDEDVTVSKLFTESGHCYLMIYWLVNSFEMYLYAKDKLWKGKFSSLRLANFSKNLQLEEEVYFARIKRCLSEQREDYSYEFKNGFFYWKRKLELSLIIEGFLPLDLEVKPTSSDLNLIEVMLKINKHLKERLHTLQSKLNTIKIDYLEHLTETEDFLNLKEKMENYVCQKFLNLISLKKSKLNMLESGIVMEQTDQSLLGLQRTSSEIE